MCAASRIGMEKESALHEALKKSYAGKDGAIEAEIGRYVCDAVTQDGLVVEVQTGSFGPLKKKAEALVAAGPLRIVHPVAAERIIELRSKEGTIVRRRRSPRKGSAWDLFSALVYAPELPMLGGLTIEVAMTEETEQRIDDGRGSWRRKGVSISNRELRSIRETVLLSEVADYRRFVPFPPSEDFGTRELATKAGISMALARKTLYVLSRIGVVEEAGKKGNAKRYRLASLRYGRELRP